MVSAMVLKAIKLPEAPTPDEQWTRIGHNLNKIKLPLKIIKVLYDQANRYCCHCSCIISNLATISI